MGAAGDMAGWLVGTQRARCAAGKDALPEKSPCSCELGAVSLLRWAQSVWAQSVWATVPMDRALHITICSLIQPTAT